MSQEVQGDRDMDTQPQLCQGPLHIHQHSWISPALGKGSSVLLDHARTMEKNWGFGHHGGEWFPSCSPAPGGLPTLALGGAAPLSTKTPPSSSLNPQHPNFHQRQGQLLENGCEASKSFMV